MRLNNYLTEENIIDINDFVKKIPKRLSMCMFNQPPFVNIGKYKSLFPVNPDKKFDHFNVYLR